MCISWVALNGGGTHTQYYIGEAMCHSALVHGAKNVLCMVFWTVEYTALKSADKYINRLVTYINKPECAL